MTNEERLVRVTKFLKKATHDPHISKGIISLDTYRHRKDIRNSNSNTNYLYGIFDITEVNTDGFLVLKKDGSNYAKVLVRQDTLPFFKVGDKINCQLRRKVFFIYWDFEIFKSYIIEEDAI